MKPNDALHGITLEQILKQLVREYGWPELSARIDVKCFNIDPSRSKNIN